MEVRSYVDRDQAQLRGGRGPDTFPLRGRPRFDGDTVSQDACRGPSPSLIRWKTK